MMLLGAGSTWAQETIAEATFDGKNETYTEGWTTTGTGQNRTDCIVIGKDENITSPTLDLSQYTEVTISIKARRYGSLSGSKATIDAAINGTSVGTTDATTTNTETSLADITFIPTVNMTAVNIVFTCTNATSAGSTHGAGIKSIVITGTLPSSVATPTFSVAEGTYTEAQSVTISCETQGATIYYTLDGSTPTNASTEYTGAINVTETTTIKAIAYDATGAASNVATATYNILLVDHEGTEDDPYTVADAINYIGTLGSSSSPSDVYVHGIISQVDSYNSTYNSITYWISDDGTTTTQMQVYSGKGLDGANFSSVDDLQVGDEVTVKGTVKMYNTTPEFDKNSIITSFNRENAEPSINADDVTLAYDATSGSFEFSIVNPVEGYNVTVATPDVDWISDVTVSADANVITFTTTVNEGTEAREGNITINYGGTTVVARKVVKVTQACYVPDYAVLPFNWAGGSSADLNATQGVTTSGLGSSDYNATNHPYLPKFDSTGDYIQVKTDSRPGKVTVGVKMLGGADTSYITVQGSSDGETFNDIEQLEISGAKNDILTLETTKDFAADNRYVRLTFTKGSNVGVGPITIEKYVATVKYYLAGSFATTDQWIDDMVELTNNDGIYTTTKTFDADTKFKIVKEDIDGTTTWYGGEGNETYRIHRDWCTDITLVDGQDFIINEAGEYTFSVNTTGTALTLTVTGFPAQEFFLAGSFNEWSTTDTKFEAGETEGVYTLTQELEAGAEFKVVSEGKYYSTNETLADNTTLQITEGTNNMTVAQAGTYTFTLAKTPNGLFLTVTFPQPVVTYYLAGSFATTEEWIDDMKELTANEDGTFSVTQEFAANTEFKIVKTVDGAESWFGGNTEDTGDEFYFIHKNWCTGIPLSADADKDGGYKNFKIESAGEYTFTLNVTDNGLFFDVTGWPISTEGNMFVKVATNDEFEDGAYLIVYEPESVAFNGGLETLDATNNSISVVINNGAIEATDATKAALFIFENGTIKSASGHYIGVTSNSNGLKQNDDATTYTNAVSFDENGNAIIAAVFDGSTMTIRYNDNSDQKRFLYLKNNGENPVQLYKLVENFVPTVTIGEAQWATYVAVDNVEFPEAVTAYVPVDVNEGHTAVMIQSVSAVQKGEPVILNGEAGTYELSIAETEPAEVNNLFEVSDGTAKSDGTFYMLSYKNETVGFRKVQSGVTIPAGKPYIVIVNTAKEFIPFGGSEATGIESFETVGFDVNAPIYDMQGRQVQKLQKGIFIQNGKKLIVK